MDEYLYRRFYEIEQRHWWFVARQDILCRYIETVLKLPHDAHVLDVGCGTGAMLKELSKRYVAYGVDSSDTAIAYCNKRGLHNTFVGNLDALPENETFHLITFFDVIEHIDNDIDVLCEAFKLLNEGGSVLITVPAYQWLWSKHDELNHHKRRYTMHRLALTVQRSGFQLIHMTYFNTLLFPLAVIRRMWDKMLNDNVDDLALPPAIINKLFLEVFRLEKVLVPHLVLPFGVSILCHAVKPRIHA
jgi:SAM-dependent methyltransferase